MLNGLSARELTWWRAFYAWEAEEREAAIEEAKK
jgi:hypothetical protein